MYYIPYLRKWHFALFSNFQNALVLGLSSLFAKSGTKEETISEVELHDTAAVSTEQFRPQASSSTNNSAQEMFRPNNSQSTTSFISQFIQNGGQSGNASQRSAISPIYGEVRSLIIRLLNFHYKIIRNSCILILLRSHYCPR